MHLHQPQTHSKSLASLFANSIVASIPSNEQKHILKYGRFIELKFGSVLCEVDEPIQRVYFPTEGFISQTASSNGAQLLNVGLIGYEGMLGATLLLDVNISPVTAIVLGAGRALSMSSAQFGRVLSQNPTLVSALKHYLYATLRQWSQASFCARFHQTEARLARFLLTAHDCTHHNAFYITQDTLAKALGVRRSSITLAASELQKQDFIQYRRGQIDIVNRNGLKTVACTCYSE